MLNALTVDVEDYFQVTAFERVVSRDRWNAFPLRVGDNTRRILDMFDEFGIKATFFVLGWVAEKEPGLAPEIARRGHEIACHGFGHELVYRIGPEKFRADIRRAKQLLEDQCGIRVNGYRAPSYSITKQSLWAIDILLETGFSYDSSIFPIHHDTYGIANASRFIHQITTPSGAITEFPLSTLSLPIAGKDIRLPVAGGGYLRFLPSSVIRWAFNRLNRKEGQPVVLYFHPWEIDPGQPRIKAPLKSTLRHYLNLRSTEAKLSSLFSAFFFSTIDNVLALKQLREKPSA